MKQFYLLLCFVFWYQTGLPQASSQYVISFDNAVHHQAKVEAVFEDIEEGVVEFRMSRSSPGRYALHEFAKNVYEVVFTDSRGRPLAVTRPDPYSWLVQADGREIRLSYTLFANHGDGTYSQIDETHAHLNMPATFMYCSQLSQKPFQLEINAREDLGWKIATQLKHEKRNRYSAPDLQYFMDSPLEISNHSLRSFELDDQEIQLALHHGGSEAELDHFFEQLKSVVLEQKKVFGELPDFDYGTYTFLACYMPNVSGDGMEHRNSTVLTSTRPLSGEGLERNLATVSHEFFHCWNVERLRPASLEPFDFTRANMSGELWFAEGFTSYYTSLMIARAGLLTAREYLQWTIGSFNYVWLSTGRNFYNPVEMSYQAPFVDAATSVDQVNRRNTFISYYNYGQMLGLALDLSLREKGLNLDDYMKLCWQRLGKTFKPYTMQNLQSLLAEYAGEAFARYFFASFIYGREMPDFASLFRQMGISVTQPAAHASIGARIAKLTIAEYPAFDSPAYRAKLTKNDKILEIEGVALESDQQLDELMQQLNPGDQIRLVYDRYGQNREAELKLIADPAYQLELMEDRGEEVSEAQLARRNAWLFGVD